MIIPLAVSAVAVTITFLYASWRDLRERRVPFPVWYPMLTVTIPMATWFYLLLFFAGMWQMIVYFLALTCIFSIVFYFLLTSISSGGRCMGPHLPLHLAPRLSPRAVGWNSTYGFLSLHRSRQFPHPESLDAHSHLLVERCSWPDRAFPLHSLGFSRSC